MLFFVTSQHREKLLKDDQSFRQYELETDEERAKILTSQVLQMSHTPGKARLSDTKGMLPTKRATLS